jgi:hypothetical protein
VVIGVALAPITWLFGPIVTLNVALTLAPVLSSLALFVLLRRWVAWTPAAFIGGLFYGFCPFILQSLTVGQLHQSFLIFPPLIVLCLDELLFRQRVRPGLVGLLLGILVALQFFVGSEILMMLVIVTSVCMVLVVLYWVRQPDKRWKQGRHAIIGLTVGGSAAVAFLAYPVWFALAGPAHLSGRIWPLPLPFYGNVLSDFIEQVRGPPHNPFSGANITLQYFGFGMLAVCGIGIVVWRRDRRLWLSALGVGISLLLSLGEVHTLWLPWQSLGNLPLLQNIFPNRFVVIAYLAAGVMLGLIVDHTYVAVGAHRRSVALASPGESDARGNQRSRWPAVMAAVIVAGVALVPMGIYLEPVLPIPTQPVVFPTWFRTVAPHLAGRQVLLVLPMPFFLEVPLTWQAINEMHYSLASGVGPEAELSRAGTAYGGQMVLDEMSSPYRTVPTVNSSDIVAVRRAMQDWGVTTVVIPVDGSAPVDEWRVLSVPVAVELMTLATGSQPVHQEHAWVWYGVEHDGPPAIRSTAAFDRCTTIGNVDQIASIRAMNTCALASTSVAP